jgi:pimeloyl-ACP methyl ester carboxylesterase
VKIFLPEINALMLCSNLQPSEFNTYADIEAVYECLERDYSARQEDIVLYGQSVGSGPTLEIATRLPNLRAVILHSPILSGVRVMYPVKRTYWFDIYKVWLEDASRDGLCLIMYLYNSFRLSLICRTSTKLGM